MSEFHVIIGLGDTGISCAHYLHQQKIPFAVIDTRLMPPGLAAFQTRFPDVVLSLGGFDANLLQKADVIVISPGVSRKEPLIAEAMVKGKRIIGDIELFASVATQPIVAITGTNAKSTVTTLVGHMMQASYKTAVGGNIGVPALDLLAQEASQEAYVLELSSFQLETVESLTASVACILNVSEDHMDRYDHLNDYIAAKQRIYKGARCTVFNRDDVATYPTHVSDISYAFTLSMPKEREFGIMTMQGEEYLAFETTPLLNVSDLPIVGKHYQANALAALAIGHGMQLEMPAMLRVLETFQGLPHRCQFVREYLGVTWFNDSKGTNVGATLAAIQGLGAHLHGKLILIAGGVGKAADFSPLAPLIKQYVRHTVLLGQDAPEIAKIMNEGDAVSYATDMEEAVIIAKNAAKPGDYVLLSPACASFDMFRNYAHRGDVFMAIVNQL